MNELVVQNEYNVYPEVIQFDTKNPTLRSPYAPNDLPFYQTRETLMDVDTFRNFLKNAESRFRASKEYKAYKEGKIKYYPENISDVSPSAVLSLIIFLLRYVHQFDFC